MLVLGIDPGLRTTGYAVVDAARSVARPTLVEAGVVRLATGPQRRPISDRLDELERDIAAILARTTPGLVAVERLFTNPKHPATVIAMAHARGVILLAIARARLPLLELPPAMVKKSLLGVGRASKAQVQAGVQRVFALQHAPTPHDMADAIAIAHCAAERSVLHAGSDFGASR